MTMARRQVGHGGKQGRGRDRACVCYGTPDYKVAEDACDGLLVGRAQALE